VCNLCNAAVDWLLAHDKRAQLKFASLQDSAIIEVLCNHLAKTPYPLNSNTSEKLKEELAMAQISLDSIVYLRNQKLYQKSSAILWIAFDLGWPWRALIIFIIVPKFLRDGVYKLIAKNRYRWFGKKDTCRLPSLEEKSRFL
jgi:predicted DCC family thiol-disulfide oxidoreductase YuxK